MIIKVEQRHIDNGERNIADGCPIYLAVLEQTGLSCFVELTEIDSSETRIVEIIELPKEAINFIVFFDIGFPVEPFSFELPIDHLLPKRERAA